MYSKFHGNLISAFTQGSGLILPHVYPISDHGKVQPISILTVVGQVCLMISDSMASLTGVICRNHEASSNLSWRPQTRQT